MSKHTVRSVAFSLPVAVVAVTMALGACGSVERPSGFNETEEDAGGGSTGQLGGDADLPDVRDGSACLSETLAAERVALSMLLVMDRSGSMTGTPNKWDVARKAMIAFADTKGAAGSKLGLTVFPPDPGGPDQCVPASYKPVVPIALLPGNGSAIKDALLSRQVTGSTPMFNAMKGGIDAMTTHLSTNPNEEGVIILVTDGDPGACSGDTVANVTSVAQTAATSIPRIRTFVVGMQGATFSNLDMIAAAGGGAPKAFDASGGGGDGGVSPQQQLLDALDKIRSSALGCEYLVPTPDPSKGVVDPESVEIDFTPGKNDPPQNFQRVADKSKCGETTGGFYYDDPKNPKRLTLCPASCEAVLKGNEESTMNVVLGCIKPVN